MVGVARWVLHLPGCQSLKMKRSVVRSMRDRMQAKFRVSVAETDFQNRWQKAELCVAFVSSDRAVAESLMARLERYVLADPRVRVIERETVFY